MPGYPFRLYGGIVPVKGVESWMGWWDRKRESCNLYIKASIERVSSILAKREEDIPTRESIYIYFARVWSFAQQLVRSV